MGMGPVLRLSRGDGAGVVGTGVGKAAGVALSAEMGTVVADEEAAGGGLGAVKGTVVVGAGTTGTEPVGGFRALPFSAGEGAMPPAEGTEPVGGLETRPGPVPNAGRTAVLAGATGAGTAGVVGEGAGDAATGGGVEATGGGKAGRSGGRRGDGRRRD